MKKHNISLLPAMMVIVAMISGCNVARISTTSTVYKWPINEQIGQTDTLQKLEVKRVIKAIITEKDDYITIRPKDSMEPSFTDVQGKISKNLPGGWRTDIDGTLYYPEIKYDNSSNDAHFHYTEFKHGLQGMTVLLKFRGNIAEGKVPRIPPMVESGSTFAMAYGFRHTWNAYNPDKNIWGKRITTFSVTAGPMLGGSAVELKAATNAPGLGGDRKSAAISYGAFAMIGTGPINIGYAIGTDRILGYGASNWVYGGKTWHGLIFGINLITF